MRSDNIQKEHYHVFWVDKGVIDCKEVQSILDADTAYNPTDSTKTTKINWSSFIVVYNIVYTKQNLMLLVLQIQLHFVQTNIIFSVNE